VQWISQGSHSGRPLQELIKKAMRKDGKRRVRRLELREGKREASQ
jgi:hypothetical protein